MVYCVAFITTFQGKARNLLVECIAHKLDISDRNVFSELKKVTDPLQRVRSLDLLCIKIKNVNIRCQ